MSSSTSLTGGKYTRDLKLRVLEHYFRNGGDVFGNKQSTAKKFGVDSKTINRFLKIPELVRAARKNAKASKAGSGSSGGFKEPLVPGTSGVGRTRPPQRQSVRITLPTQPDESIVSQSADGSTSSIGKLLKIFELGTQEIRDLLAAECDLIYECRVCRALFRSVANLLAHKRRYCTRPAAETRHVFGSGPGQSLAAPSDGVMVLPLPATIDRLPEVRQAAAEEARAAVAQPVPTVRLEALPGSDVAVLQTVGEPELSVGQRLEEVNKMTAAAGRTVRLGRDGRVVESDAEDDGEETEETEQAEGEDGRHVCQHCNTTFSTRKTLSHHVRSLHSSTRIYYPCCLCSAAFINMFSVERHLQKVHKKKQDEIDVLKEGIKQKSFHRSVTEPQSAASTANPNMPMKVGPPPAGLLRCAECLVCYPSAQLLATHQLTAHARTAERQTEPTIQVRNDYLDHRTASETLVAMATPAAEATDLTNSAQCPSTPPSPSPPPAESAAAAFNTDIESRLLALADMKRIRCKQCGSAYKTTTGLRRHIAGHIGWTRHGCPSCSHRSYSRFDVVRHMQRAHEMTAKQAEKLLQRSERQKAGKKPAGKKKPAASAAVAAAVSEKVKEEPSVKAIPSVTAQLCCPPGKTYEMRDLTVCRSAPPVVSADRLHPSLIPQPGIPSIRPSLPFPNPPPPPAIPQPQPLPFSHHPASSHHPQVPKVAPPPTLARRRPGRKSLASIIHYISSSARSPSLGPGPAGSSRPEISERIGFRDTTSTTSELTAISEPTRAEDMHDGVGNEADDAADDVEENGDQVTEDDDLEEFMSLSSGAELEPGAVWRTLPPLVPLLGDPGRDLSGHGAETPAHSPPPQRHGFQRLSDGTEQHDCNENIEHRLVRDAPTPPVDTKQFPMSPKGKALSPYLAKYPSDGRNFFPRVLLTDIALRRWNSSPTPARPASPGGSAVYPAGARLDPTAVSRETGSPTDEKRSPPSAASASGGISPNGVAQERRGRAPRPLRALGKGCSEADLRLVAIDATEAMVAAAAAGGTPRSPDGRLKGSARSLRVGQRSVSAPGRVGPTKQVFTPTTNAATGSPGRSPGSSPTASGRRAGRKVSPRATTAAAARQELKMATGDVSPATPTVVPYVPSVWPPLVRKRSWSNPSDEREPASSQSTAISAAESVKRRRYRRLSERAGVS